MTKLDVTISTLTAWVTAFAVVAASVAHGQLTARVGEAFYLPLAFERNDRQPLAGLDAAVTVTPPGILPMPGIVNCGSFAMEILP